MRCIACILEDDKPSTGAVGKILRHPSYFPLPKIREQTCACEPAGAQGTAISSFPMRSSCWCIWHNVQRPAIHSPRGGDALGRRLILSCGYALCRQHPPDMTLPPAPQPIFTTTDAQLFPKPAGMTTRLILSHQHSTCSLFAFLWASANLRMGGTADFDEQLSCCDFLVINASVTQYLCQ